MLFRSVNVYNCWDEEVHITPGQLNEVGGKYALISLQSGVQALKAGHIKALITAPIHKKNIQSANFNYTGHTPYLKAMFEVDDVVMLMTAQNLRVALVTEHEYGLIEVTTVEENYFIDTNQLQKLEQYTRWHYDLDINLEGIEVIDHLLSRVKNLQNEINSLQNRLRTYEETSRKILNSE